MIQSMTFLMKIKFYYQSSIKNIIQSNRERAQSLILFLHQVFIHKSEILRKNNLLFTNHLISIKVSLCLKKQQNFNGTSPPAGYRWTLL